jgi:hypothetical protein
MSSDITEHVQYRPQQSPVITTDMDSVQILDRRFSCSSFSIFLLSETVLGGKSVSSGDIPALVNAKSSSVSALIS